MSVVAGGGDYLKQLLGGQARVPASRLERMNRLRADAVDRVGALTVPSTRDEEWRFTDLSPLTKLTFQPALAAGQAALPDIAQFLLAEAPTRLVFVDGVYAPALSHAAPDAGVTVSNLPAGASARRDLVDRHLGRHAGFQDNVFTALNTAFLHDGALIVVPRNTRAEAPVHLLFVATRAQGASYPRSLIIAEAGSEATIIEDFVSLQSAAYFTSAVTEITIADNAKLSHVRVQREGEAAFHIASCAVALAHASRYRSVSVALGARLSRLNLDVLQAAEGAECSIDGLALIGADQLADTHTFVDHATPNGTSRQLHKCIADGTSRAVFNGKVMVRANAQHTDATQSNRNLLLSAKAQVDTKPQLEIFADDVKCAHGATVGQIDAEELFYLKSRGLSESAARTLLTYAFGAEIIERIPVASLRRNLEEAVVARTAGTP